MILWHRPVGHCLRRNICNFRFLKKALPVSWRGSAFLVGSFPAKGKNLYHEESDGNAQYGSNYIAGGSTSSCDGNGIYFLTDGAPNSTKDEMARTILNRSLTDAYKFSAKPSGEYWSRRFRRDHVLPCIVCKSIFFHQELTLCSNTGTGDRFCWWRQTDRTQSPSAHI